MIIALCLAVAGAGYLGWRLYLATRALRRSERQVQELQQDRAIRQNLQHMLDGRNAEVKRLRARLRKREDELDALEKQTSELNLNLFHESGLRILREKEEGARRMKLELMEKQLDDLRAQLRAQRMDAEADVTRLTGIIVDQQARIDRLTAAAARRAARKRQEALPDQMTMNEILNEGND
ncbi:MAG: hypothetical protein IJ646_08255 [Clostridia bacterium]|nr:hypothetical protein [Clostridia bacterium]